MLQTPTGQALHGVYRWIAQGCDSELLAAWLRARLCTFDRVLGEPPDAPSVAAVLDRGGHGAGLHRHQSLIDRLTESCAADDPERGRLRRVRRALDALASLVPRQEPVTVEDMTTAGIAFVMWFGPGAIESAPVTSIVERLRDVADAVGTLTGTRAQLARMMQRLVEDHRVEASAARPGALHVAPLDRAGYTGRLHTYIVGLDAASFSGRHTPDPVLPDTERAALDGVIPHAARPGDAEWHLYRLMRSVSKTVTLSARTCDLASGAEESPSAFFFRVASQLDYADEAADVPAFPLVPSPSDLALDVTEQLLAHRAATGFEDAVHAQAPWLVEGLHAREHREAPIWTRFDGLTGRPAPQHALGTGAIATSASRLETLAACPYRYFLKHVLEVEPPDVPDEDPTRWLDPLQFGALLHDLFHDFMVRARGPITDADAHADALITLLDQKIEAVRGRIPVQHEAAFRADRTRLKQAAQVFLAAEARRTEAEPVAFEVSFGQGRAGGPHRARPVPLALSNDVALLLQGRIDRVDRLPNGDYAIWDYKTGSMRGYNENDLHDGGQRLQWALYAYAFDAMLEATGANGTVQQSGYFFATARTYGQRLTDSPPPREYVGAQLAPLLDLAAQGAFPHVQKRRGACRFCDYRRICADEATSARDVRAMTLDASGDPISDAIARWMADG
jgi:ATP-dependent helicase/nuclease subunit B